MLIEGRWVVEEENKVTKQMHGENTNAPTITKIDLIRVLSIALLYLPKFGQGGTVEVEILLSRVGYSMLNLVIPSFVSIMP